MKQPDHIQCPVCKSNEHAHFISTQAMMHKARDASFHFNKCAACESVFLTNRVNKENLGDYYTDHYLPYMGPSAWGKFQAFVESSQRKLDKKRMRVVAKVRKSKGDFSILDVGCGNPSFLNTVRQGLNANCTGLDFSDNGWKNETYEDLNLIKSPFERFQPSRPFDVITLWHFLEHDYHLHSTVIKLHECLKPGGKLIIEVPDYKSLTAKMQKQYWQGWHSPRHLSLFTLQGFKALFPKEKWHISQHYRYGTLDAFTLWWLGKMEKKHFNWSAPMEKVFWPLVLLKIITFPLFIFEKVFPMAIQLIVIEKK